MNLRLRNLWVLLAAHAALNDPVTVVAQGYLGKYQCTLFHSEDDPSLLTKIDIVRMEKDITPTTLAVNVDKSSDVWKMTIICESSVIQQILWDTKASAPFTLKITEYNDLPKFSADLSWSRSINNILRELNVAELLDRWIDMDLAKKRSAKTYNREVSEDARGVTVRQELCDGKEPMEYGYRRDGSIKRYISYFPELIPKFRVTFAEDVRKESSIRMYDSAGKPNSSIDFILENDETERYRLPYNMNTVTWTEYDVNGRVVAMSIEGNYNLNNSFRITEENGMVYREYFFWMHDGNGVMGTRTQVGLPVSEQVVEVFFGRDFRSEMQLKFVFKNGAIEVYDMESGEVADIDVYRRRRLYKALEDLKDALLLPATDPVGPRGIVLDAMECLLSEYSEDLDTENSGWTTTPPENYLYLFNRTHELIMYKAILRARASEAEQRRRREQMDRERGIHHDLQDVAAHVRQEHEKRLQAELRFFTELLRFKDLPQMEKQALLNQHANKLRELKLLSVDSPSNRGKNTNLIRKQREEEEYRQTQWRHYQQQNRLRYA